MPILSHSTSTVPAEITRKKINCSKWNKHLTLRTAQTVFFWVRIDMRFSTCYSFTLLLRNIHFKERTVHRLWYMSPSLLLLHYSYYYFACKTEIQRHFQNYSVRVTALLHRASVTWSDTDAGIISCSKIFSCLLLATCFLHKVLLNKSKNSRSVKLYTHC